jgi:hypothetical protein
LRIGVLYSVFPAATASGDPGEMFRLMGKKSGEQVTPSLSSNSATHVWASTDRPIRWARKRSPRRVQTREFSGINVIQQILKNPSL